MGNLEVVPSHQQDLYTNAPINYNYQTLVEIGKLEIRSIRESMQDQQNDTSMFTQIDLDALNQNMESE